MRAFPGTALLVVLVVAAPASAVRADVVTRTLQVNVDFAQRYGSGQPARTPADAKVRLFAEIASECPRLEKMSSLVCRVEGLAMRSDERAGRSAILASVRFVLRTRADDAAKRPSQDEFRFERKGGSLF